MSLTVPRSRKKLKIHEPNHCFVTVLMMPALIQVKEMEGEECEWEVVIAHCG